MTFLRHQPPGALRPESAHSVPCDFILGTVILIPSFEPLVLIKSQSLKHVVRLGNGTWAGNPPGLVGWLGPVPTDGSASAAGPYTNGTHPSAWHISWREELLARRSSWGSPYRSWP
jgi:hypothetical protein